MVIVDQEWMAVTMDGVTVRMPVRLGAFPALMIVLVMQIIVGVQMFVVHRMVLVIELPMLTRRPQAPRPRRADDDQTGHGRERRRQPMGCAQPAGQRIADQPAGV